ncbi:unnamed protein product [Prorocentrum cordatum]|uniref:Integrase catalytic domain-containing protein n=1 Tax=Prorocentrum cordatum TaxID=2364126 RepID=A0ABN9TRW5_9DINO|nr:unnamed protein product [Polarella glacialis]
MYQHPATSRMRKAELLTELALWDEDGTHMTCDMLRARLRQIYKAMPVGGAPVRHKKKAELVEDATTMGCVLTGKETRGDLQILITEKHEQCLGMVKGSDRMPFGRHRTLTIQELLEKEREYAGWLVSWSNPRLKRLTDWLVMKGIKSEDMRNKFELPQPRVKGEKLEKTEAAAMETGTSKEEQIIDLLGDMKMAMNALTTRVQKVLLSRKRSKRLIRNCLILVMDQVADRGHVHWEWPKELQPYRWPEVKQVFRECDMRPVVCDSCMLGVKARDTGLLVVKPWEVWTTSDRMCQRMAIRCDGRHEHSPCVGGVRTAATAYYPDAFVKRAARAMLEEPRMEGICNLVREFEAEDEEIDAIYAVSASKTGIDLDELRKVEIAARRIHAACGHCPFAQVARSLAARGADKRIVEHVKGMRCPACDESQKQGPPRPVGSADEVPKKWAVLQSDLAEWEDPCSHEKFKLVLYLDQGSKLGVGHVLFKMVKSKNATAEELKDSIWSRWISYFGRPRIFQVDPEGAWMSKTIRENMESSGIQMDPIPGQAHWQIGGVERLISLIKDLMTVLARECPGRSCEEYLARAMAAYNELDRHRGFSPLQVALGRAPDLDGTFMDAPGDPVNLPALESEAVDTAFGENFKFMRQAQEAMLRWVSAERARRASHARSRKLNVYTPGTLVYYFRNPKSSSMTGRFYGPARVLATETVHRNGEVQPRPRVWLNACGRLIRCDPCQLRDASDREVAEHEIIHGTEMPWTFNNMSQSLRAGQYEDLADDPRLIPSDTEFVDAGDAPPLPTVPPAAEEPKRRISGKRVPTEPHTSSKQPRVGPSAASASAPASQGREPETATFPATPARPPNKSRTTPSRPSPYDWDGLPPAAAAGGDHYGKERSDRQKRRDLTEEQGLTAEVQPFECFWSREDNAIEVEISLPEGARGGTAARDLPAFVATQLRRQRAEVRERTLSAADLEKLKKAKVKEAQEWIKEMVLEGLPSHVTAPSDRPMRLRWVLTWKIDPAETGGRRAKARLVILGFQDPDLTTEESYAPTATRTARQVFPQKAANLKMRVAKGDVKSAFLQGEELDRDLFVKPTGEIAEMLGLRSGQVWQQARRQVMEAFRWTEWEYDTFTQCGVDITQRPDLGFTLSQATYTEQIEEIEVPAERRKQPSAPVTNAEKSQFRAATGSLQWKGTQTGPDILAELSLLQSLSESCTVDDLLKVNKLIKRTKETKDRVLKIFPFVDSELAVVGWGDAAFWQPC